ncbi:hypothetical protein ACOMHN_050187 [Nucella lapillus]
MVTGDSTLCTGGYTLQCGRCLRAGSFFDAKTYSEAKQQCRNNGGGLLVMTKTLADLQCVRNFHYTQTRLTSPFWVGADDTKSRGQFTWNDGTPLPRNSDLWGPTIVKNTTSADSLTETEQSCSRDTHSCQTTLTTDIPDEASTTPSQTTLTTDIPDEASTALSQTTLTIDIPDESSTVPIQTTLTTDIPDEASTDPIQTTLTTDILTRPPLPPARRP